MGGIEQLAETVATDMEQRLPGQRKTRRGKLALLGATMLEVRSANLMDVAACLRRPAERLDSRYQWIKRFLANARVVSDAVMAPYGREVLARLSAQGQTVVLLIDQTKVSERHQVVMVAVRLGGRALPLAWRVKETQGAIGFAEQRAALEAAARLLPAGTKPVLTHGAERHGFNLTPVLVAGAAGVAGRSQSSVAHASVSRANGCRTLCLAAINARFAFGGIRGPVPDGRPQSIPVRVGAWSIERRNNNSRDRSAIRAVSQLL